MTQAAAESPSPLSPQVESRPGLLKALGPGMAIAIVVGNVIGSGIYAKPGRIAAEAGDFTVIIAAWILAGVLCTFGALCFAELAVMLPRAGGLYVYLREAYGRPVAFLFGWTEFLFGRPASIGALSVFFVAMLSEAIDSAPRPVEVILVAFAVIALMAWVNVIGVIWGGRMQGVTTALKAGLLAAVAALPFILPLFDRPGFDVAHYASTLAPAGGETETQGDGETEDRAGPTVEHRAGQKKTPAARFALVLLAVMWAYNGWHGITPVAEEVRNPQRNIPLALFGGLGILVLLYVWANVAYHGVVPMEEMARPENQEHVARIMVSKLLGPVGTQLVSLSIALSALGAINSNFLLGPRISFAMGRDDIFFRPLGRVHVNYRTPATAIIVQAAMGMALIVGSAVLVERIEALKGKSVFDMLTEFVVFSASFFYVLAVAAVFVLRWKRPDWPRPYRTLGYPVVPIIYLAFYAWFLLFVFLGQPVDSLIGLGLTALGLPAYFLYRDWARRNPEVTTDGQ